ncbi:MAG TPA: hypothetical protein VKZ59_08610, partial [Acidobacteriota bacterium]|nr:hypothetical protein [Acidobacteriota bacterium]
DSDFQGTIEVTSDLPIVALTLQSTENELAATPVLPFQTGTITSVNAGAGLAGGGSTGDITIELAPLIAPGGSGIDGQIGVLNAGNSIRAVMGIVDNTGVLGVNNAAGSASAVITADSLGGVFQALNNDEDVAAELGANVAGSGLVQVINNNETGTPTDGVAVMTTTNAGAGFIAIRNPSAGRDLVRLTHLDSNSQVGVVAVFGQTGNEPIAGINGATGEVFGQTKSFIVDDPTQEGRMIQYTSIEGPEAAIYVRGQVNLRSGRAFVQFPPHFAALAVDDSITITLTPRSAASLGVAAASVSGDGFEVVELHSGTGSYPVDYVAYAVRQGYEDYQVYRDAEDLLLPGSGRNSEEDNPPK